MYNIIIGRAVTFISLFGLMRESVFGMNSPTMSTRIVEMIVWQSKIVNSLIITSGNTLIITGFRSLAMAIP